MEKQHIDFEVRVEKFQSHQRLVVNWGRDWEYNLIPSEEQNILIAEIFHKVINLELKETEDPINKKEEFEVIGQTLFKILFYPQKDNKNILGHFQDFHKQALAEESPRRFRFKIKFDQAEEFDKLATLPWEYLFFDGDNEGFLSCHPKRNIDFVRLFPRPHLYLKQSQNFHIIEPVFRILLIISSPSEGYLQIPRKEIEQLRTFFHSLEEDYNKERQLIEIKIVENPDHESFGRDLLSMVDQEGFHADVIHFFGHGTLDRETRNGQLLFVEEGISGSYKEKEVSDSKFAGWLSDLSNQPRMVFLHICDGAKIGKYSADKGAALQVLKAGIPFVVAMQNPIRTDHSLEFVKTFYQHFLEGADIAEAVTEGRYNLARVGYKGKYSHKAFGTPVLYTFYSAFLRLNVEEASAERKEVLSYYKLCENPRCYRAQTSHPFPIADNFCDNCRFPLSKVIARKGAAAYSDPNLAKGYEGTPRAIDPYRQESPNGGQSSVGSGLAHQPGLERKEPVQRAKGQADERDHSKEVEAVQTHLKLKISVFDLDHQKLQEIFKLLRTAIVISSTKYNSLFRIERTFKTNFRRIEQVAGSHVERQQLIDKTQDDLLLLVDSLIFDDLKTSFMNDFENGNKI